MFKRILNDNYLKNFFSLAGSQIISQSILIGVTPLLTRIYTPIELGQYEFFKTSTLVIVVIGFLNYDSSVYSSKSNLERINSFFLSFLVLSAICILTSFLLFFFNHSFIKLTGSKIKDGWFWSLPLCAFFSALTNLMMVVLTKNGSFKLLSSINIIVSILVATIQLLFGWLNMGYWGLVYSTIFVQCFAFLLYFFPFYKEFKNSFKDCSVIEMKKLFLTHWRLPLLIFPGNFLNNIVQSVPVFYLNKVDNELLGYFSISKRLIDFPLSFVSSAIKRLYIKELADEIENTGIGMLTFFKNLKIYGFIALILILGVFIFTEPLLPLIFGIKWLPAVPYVKILSIYFTFKFVFGSLSIILIFGTAPKLAFLWQLGYAIVLFTFFSFLSSTNIEPRFIIFYFVLIGVLFYLLYGFICSKVALSKKYLSLNKI
jgi:O-antigen/teichoic acid export membrane protein